MKNWITAFCFGVALSACDSGQNSQTKSEATEIKTAKAEAPAENVATQSDTASQQKEPEEKETEEKNHKKLNLSLPDNLSRTGSDEPLKEERALPDMFAKQESRAKVSGGVHRDEENPDLMHSVNGGEVTVEFKTD